MKVLVATEEEYELAKKYLYGIEIIKTGVGASNIINTCCNKLSYKDDVINIGFCGSTNLPIGEVCNVSKSYRLVDNTVQFEDFRNGYEFCEEGYPCYTSNSFVTKSDTQDAILFDMELNYIVAFPFRTLGSIKIVSDNLSVDEYSKTISLSNEETWNKVKVLIYSICQKKGIM